MLLRKLLMGLNEYKNLLTIAISIAKEAGNTIRMHLNEFRKIKLEFKRDVKIEADDKLEAVIIKRLWDETKYPILSEESGLLRDSDDTNFRWIIDPLDGSLNFSRGIPLCCISIAFWDGMTPILGVVYDFNNDEMFYGIVGECARLNNVPIKVSGIDEKSKAVLCTGFPVRTDFSTGKVQEFVKNIKKFKKIRLLGTAALSLCYVACGRADSYQENNIKIWDVAAGLAITKAAGGTIHIEFSAEDKIINVRAASSNLIL